MTETKQKKKYQIRVPGALVEVSKSTYLTYYRMDRRARFLEEKDDAHGRVRYSDLDTEETTGENMLPDLNSVSVEEQAIANVLKEKLSNALKLLPGSERDLIKAIYFEGLSERQFAQRTGTHYMTIHSRKTVVLRKLKKLMEK